MGKVRNPKALAAVIGRRKYGAGRMAQMSAAGRRRKKRGGRRHGKPGGGKRFTALASKLGKRY